MAQKGVKYTRHKQLGLPWWQWRWEARQAAGWRSALRQCAVKIRLRQLRNQSAATAAWHAAAELAAEGRRHCLALQCKRRILIQQQAMQEWQAAAWRVRRGRCERETWLQCMLLRAFAVWRGAVEEREEILLVLGSALELRVQHISAEQALRAWAALLELRWLRHRMLHRAVAMLQRNAMAGCFDCWVEVRCEQQRADRAHACATARAISRLRLYFHHLAQAALHSWSWTAVTARRTRQLQARTGRRFRGQVLTAWAQEALVPRGCGAVVCWSWLSHSMLRQTREKPLRVACGVAALSSLLEGSQGSTRRLSRLLPSFSKSANDDKSEHDALIALFRTELEKAVATSPYAMATDDFIL